MRPGRTPHGRQSADGRVGGIAAGLIFIGVVVAVATLPRYVQSFEFALLASFVWPPLRSVHEGAELIASTWIAAGFVFGRLTGHLRAREVVPLALVAVSLVTILIHSVVLPVAGIRLRWPGL